MVEVSPRHGLRHDHPIPSCAFLPARPKLIDSARAPRKAYKDASPLQEHAEGRSGYRQPSPCHHWYQWTFAVEYHSCPCNRSFFYDQSGVASSWIPFWWPCDAPYPQGGSASRPVLASGPSCTNFARTLGETYCRLRSRCGCLLSVGVSFESPR